MKGKEKRIALFLIVLLVSGGWWESTFPETRYRFPEVSAGPQPETTDLSARRIQAGEDFEAEEQAGITGRTNYKDKELWVDETFTSSLPLVILDTGEQKPRRGVVWDSEKEYYVPTGEDPYAYGEISVIDRADRCNRPGDKAETHAFCKVKVRGNSSGNYDKKQYLLKLTDREGKAEKHSMLGMGDDSQWILNVSFIDKSLLRNYLAYITAGEIMPYTPDARFCEVLWKGQDGYRYEGVYLLLESVKVGKHRVDLPSYSENTAVTPALLRRDRYNVNGYMLENFAAQNNLASGFLDVEYPEKEVLTERGVKNITRQVDRLEEALYADSWEDFVRYRDFIDMGSFVDYFILNEFFMNYDAGYNSTYMYMDYSGKVCMGPVWDFDQAMDNNQTISAILETTAFHSAPWFDRLLQDPVFTAAVIERYKELRRSILSDASLEKFVRETVEYLGTAVERDWARWGYYYIDGNYLQTEPGGTGDRNQKTHRGEVEKILHVLSVHGAWMDEHLDSLYQFKKLSLEEANVQTDSRKEDYRSALAVVFIGVFFISVRLVLKYESE